MLPIWPAQPSGRSLLSAIPATRSCADAAIEPHWCVCLRWQPIADRESELVMRLARAVVDEINRYTAAATAGDLCARWYVQRVTWAAQLAPSDNLLRFSGTNDGDGFLAKLDARRMRVAERLYQVKVVAKPGDAIFEASVQVHNDAAGNGRRDDDDDDDDGGQPTWVASARMSVDLAHVSRVNKYGEQAACIMESNPELRKFCNCRAVGDE